VFMTQVVDQWWAQVMAKRLHGIESPTVFSNPSMGPSSHPIFFNAFLLVSSLFSQFCAACSIPLIKAPKHQALCRIAFFKRFRFHSFAALTYFFARRIHSFILPTRVLQLPVTLFFNTQTFFQQTAAGLLELSFILALRWPQIQRVGSSPVNN
jgi:hypothetical protein